MIINVFMKLCGPLFSKKSIFMVIQYLLVFYIITGLTASFVTIAMGVRATFRGNMDRSMRLLDVRTGLAFVTFTALVVYQYRMRREQKHELLDLKRKILMELGEESMET